MKNNLQIRFIIGFQDYLAISLAIISLILVSFFYPINFYLYIVCIALFFSLLLEKKVQVLLIINSLTFLFIYQFLPIYFSNMSVLEFLSLNFSKLTSNSFIIFLGFASFLAILSISIITNITLVLKSENQQYLDYVNTFSSIGFILIALTISILLSQDTNISVFLALSSISVNFSFLITIYLNFSLIINLFYIFFTLIFLCFLIIKKISLMVPHSHVPVKEVKAKRKQTEGELQLKKSKSRKVRGV